MNNVIIKPENRMIQCEDGALLLDVLADAGLPVKSPCGGSGICGKCSVRASGGLSERTESENRLTVDPGQRLACQARVTGDAEVINGSSLAGHAYEFPVNRDSDFGIAVDVGTTTMQISLVDIMDESANLIASFLNPQRRYGHDVISRVRASEEQPGFQALSGILRSSIDSESKRALAGLGVADERIKSVCFSGNTAMMYFIFGIHVSPLGKFPYRAPVLDYDAFSADRTRVITGSGAAEYALPSASAFIGGDLIAGLALLDRMEYRDNIFFIDLGTNGEMFIRKGGDDIFAASCAMGPALEGMNISYGMTADDGAINHFWMDGGNAGYSVIGGGPPAGICGTGIIDAVAALLDENIILKTGAFNKTGLEHGAFRLAGPVSVTQNDIRNVQLARAASRAASEMLLEAAQCGPDEIRQVVIAGAFGENLDVNSFRRLGFIPEFRNAEYLFFGNTSLKAAERCCYDALFRKRAGELRDNVRVIELSARPDFNDRYIAAINFL